MIRLEHEVWKAHSRYLNIRAAYNKAEEACYDSPRCKALMDEKRRAWVAWRRIAKELGELRKERAPHVA